MICVCINMSIGCYWCQALHLVLPFWFLLTRVVPDKFQKSSKTVVCVCVCVKCILARGYLLLMKCHTSE